MERDFQLTTLHEVLVVENNTKMANTDRQYGNILVYYLGN